MDVNHGIIKTGSAQLCLRVGFNHQLKESVEFVLASLHARDELAARRLPQHAVLSLEGPSKRPDALHTALLQKHG